ncbi:hypothetical protein RJ640_005531 [Escallonia rubra]|uniref:Non-haem dioxygenase N-terminal domain-containing protein n=1 Tax=Escallonia rubra TaxID=112253 RepID=A0AA88QUG5_9ASTE|nr:hypothetical protein RJ640_005531 [Escallonia rubra]
MDSPDPPFQDTYKTLFSNFNEELPKNGARPLIVEEMELPLIDLGRLSLGPKEREACKREIAEASQEWGFFQVVNHGVSREILEKMRSEQVKVLKRPFHEKASDKFLNFPAGSYRWGTPSATCLRQLAWSEAFHVPSTDISGLGGLTNLSTSPDFYMWDELEIRQYSPR